MLDEEEGRTALHGSAAPSRDPARRRRITATGPRRDASSSRHTHPYDKDEGGHKGVSFSGADLSQLVLVDERMAVVNAGDAEFVAVKSKEFDDMVKPLDSPQAALAAGWNKPWTDTFAAATWKCQVRVEAAVKAICGKLYPPLLKGLGQRDSRASRRKVVVTPTTGSKETAEALASVGAEATA